MDTPFFHSPCVYAPILHVINFCLVSLCVFLFCSICRSCSLYVLFCFCFSSLSFDTQSSHSRWLCLLDTGSARGLSLFLVVGSWPSYKKKALNELNVINSADLILSVFSFSSGWQNFYLYSYPPARRSGISHTNKKLQCKIYLYIFIYPSVKPSLSYLLLIFYGVIFIASHRSLKMWWWSCVKKWASPNSKKSKSSPSLSLDNKVNQNNDISVWHRKKVQLKLKYCTTSNSCL